VREAAVAIAVALALLVSIRGSSRTAFNTRGVTTPGILEAFWNFDETSGRVALDSSGHNLLGTVHGEPKRAAGVSGGAVSFNGVNYIVATGSDAFRLTGSMTISAWIMSRSFPKDDAAIVSQFKNGAGYQLDTTVDTSLRVIGFKLTNSCGDLMARYGATPL